MASGAPRAGGGYRRDAWPAVAPIGQQSQQRQPGDRQSRRGISRADRPLLTSAVLVAVVVAYQLSVLLLQSPGSDWSAIQPTWALSAVAEADRQQQRGGLLTTGADEPADADMKRRPHPSSRSSSSAPPPRDDEAGEVVGGDLRQRRAGLGRGAKAVPGSGCAMLLRRRDKGARPSRRRRERPGRNQISTGRPRPSPRPSAPLRPWQAAAPHLRRKTFAIDAVPASAPREERRPTSPTRECPTHSHEPHQVGERWLARCSGTAETVERGSGAGRGRRSAASS